MDELKPCRQCGGEAKLYKYRTYTSPSLQALCSMRISTGNSDWGAEKGKVYYVLKIWEVKKEDKKQC